MSNTVPKCACRCHRDATTETLTGEAYSGVEVTDALAAVTACAYCRNRHVPALSDNYLPPQHWTPHDDADASGEGAE